MGNCVCSRRRELYYNRDLAPEPKSIRSMKFRSGCSHCKRREEDWICPQLGGCSCPRNALPLSSCVFYSPHIEGLFEGERSELETTQAHWIEVDEKNDVEMERVGEENCKYFDEVLKKDVRWGDFFSKFEGLIVNEKIGKGGQAEIFASEMKYGDYKVERLVAKVFKKNTPLRDLKRQWPSEWLSRVSVNGLGYFPPFDLVYGGAFIRDGVHKNRFSFVMKRRLCDLRTAIDEHVLNLVRTNSHGPPFGDIEDVCTLLRSIAYHMVKLHVVGVVHRDIKASNVLIDSNDSEIMEVCINYLRDFECALGAMGTGFWGPPEILEQVQKKVPSH